MHEVPRQEPLFELEEEEQVTHFFYATTNSYTAKLGQSRDVLKRMKKDSQYRGHLLIFANPCACQLRRDAQGRLKCEQEFKWERAHARDRLPESEQYRMTEDVRTALRFPVGNDQQGIAVLEWARRNGMGRTA